MNDKAPMVFVVDDDPSVRKSLERLLRSADHEVVTFASAGEFLDQLDSSARGCVLLDVAMPALDGLELQRRLGEVGCSLPIVFLTGHGDIPMSVQAMKRGAVNFLSKPVADTDLLSAIEEAMERDRSARQDLAGAAEVRERLAALTPREREVLELVVSGRLNKQIAAELGTVEKTIKVHRARVMEKMRARSLAELVRLAQLAGIAPAMHRP